MQFRQFQIARIIGIPVIIDYSWLPMALMHVLLLALFWLPVRITPAWPLWANIALGAAITGLFFASVLVHELAHSLVARLEGIRIHDIQLHIFGGWARLVGEPRTAMAEFRVAIAGPASSFLLGMFFLGILLLMQRLGSRNPLAVSTIEMSYYLSAANIFLAMFNLLPGLPLDGGRVVRAILWHRRKDILSATRTAKMIGVGIAYMLISYGLFLIGYGFIRGTIWRDLLISVWLIVIGLFLKSAAENDYRHRERQQAHEEARKRDIDELRITGTVGAVMTAPAVSVAPDLRISEFIDDILSANRQTVFPVARDGRLHGILTLLRLRDVPKEMWEKVIVRDVMEPISDDLFITVMASIAHAERKIRTNSLGYLAVIDQDGYLIGYVNQNDFENAA